ncbi:MAG: tRNA-dihydrouridine synthase [Synergistaceae bacterium]|nr:tRNA-dihydrouridine synthase [Synergistaceae bacterium]
MRLGGVEVSNPIWLAPLAGVTTRPFRAFHAALGAGLVHTEMISATGVSHKNRKTFRMIQNGGGPRVALQLFGPNAGEMALAAEMALAVGHFSALEVNMACPMPKVTKKCGGAALMSNPAEAALMVKSLKAFGIPVWAKLRITDRAIHPLPIGEFCETLITAGASLLILHGRTPQQRYEGAADKGAVCEVAARLPGMIAASGDFFAPEDAAFYLSGGCVAVLAARGALKDAYLIPKTLAALGFPVDERFVAPSFADQAEAIIKTGREASLLEGAPFALITARRMLSGMFKGCPGVSSLRQSCSQCRDWESFEKSLTEWLENVFPR